MGCKSIISPGLPHMPGGGCDLVGKPKKAPAATTEPQAGSGSDFGRPKSGGEGGDGDEAGEVVKSRRLSRSSYRLGLAMGQAITHE